MQLGICIPIGSCGDLAPAWSRYSVDLNGTMTDCHDPTVRTA